MPKPGRTYEEVAKEFEGIGLDLEKLKAASGSIHRNLRRHGFSDTEIYASLALAAHASRWASKHCDCESCKKREELAARIPELLSHYDEVADASRRERVN